MILLQFITLITSPEDSTLTVYIQKYLTFDKGFIVFSEGSIQKSGKFVMNTVNVEILHKEQEEFLQLLSPQTINFVLPLQTICQMIDISHIGLFIHYLTQKQQLASALELQKYQQLV